MKPLIEKKICINCKRFGESNKKFYCFMFGKYNNIIHNPEKECCNFYDEKEAEK